MQGRRQPNKLKHESRSSRPGWRKQLIKLSQTSHLSNQRSQLPNPLNSRPTSPLPILLPRLHSVLEQRKHSVLEKRNDTQPIELITSRTELNLHHEGHLDDLSFYSTDHLRCRCRSPSRSNKIIDDNHSLTGSNGVT